MASVSSQSFLLHGTHSHIMFLVPVTASIFLSQLKCLNKPCHVIQLQSSLVLFIYARDFIKLLPFISCPGSDSQSYSVHSCNWFQITFHHFSSALIVLLEVIVIFWFWHNHVDLKLPSSRYKIHKFMWFFFNMKHSSVVKFSSKNIVKFKIINPFWKEIWKNSWW